MGQSIPDSAWAVLFYGIGNCVKIRATSIEKRKAVNLFGSGSGHWSLFMHLYKGMKETFHLKE